MHARRPSIWGLYIRSLVVLAFLLNDVSPATAGPADAAVARADGANARAADRPNILWIIAEDMGPEFGAYGAPEVRTPTVDRLAAQGMRFTNAFTTSPVCSTSRSAFHTGMYQMAIGAHNHRSHRAEDPSPYPWPLPDGVRVISDWMRHAGYYTANVVHLPDGVSFAGTGKTDWNFTYNGRPFDTDAWVDLKDRQPFFAEINFPESHRGEAWDTAHERIDQPADPDRVVLPPYYPDHPVVREDWAQYLNAVMAFDEKVGVVLDLLEREGLRDHTIVVLMADHGRAMVRGKQWPYDSGLHIPLIVHIPDRYLSVNGYEAGGVSDHLVSAIDVTATTLALAGISIPPAMQGRPFFGPHRADPRKVVFGGRDRGDETVDLIRTARTRRYRYLRNYYPERPFLQTNRYKEATYPTIWVLRKLAQEDALTPAQARLLASERPREELYDVMEDPYEIRNLADSPAHQEILKQLRRSVDDWVDAIDDRGMTPEDPDVIKYYEQKMIENYDERIEALRREWGIEE